MKNNKIGYYNYTVILTYMGVFSSCIGIFYVLECRYDSAMILLMLSGLCDMFDGTVAATKKRDKYEKIFGIQIDSLSDLISFGVFPALFAYQICDRNIISKIISVIYILAALIRLAYFNTLEEHRQNETPEKSSSFLGVPVTTIVIFLPIVYVMYSNDIFENNIYFNILLVLTGTGFLTPINIKKPDFIGKLALIIIGMIETVSLFFIMG